MVQFDEGNIRLRGIVNPDSLSGDPRPYLTGGIYSWRKLAFQYGRIEIRARLDQAYGMWPAIWMLSENDIYPDQHDRGLGQIVSIMHCCTGKGTGLTSIQQSPLPA